MPTGPNGEKRPAHGMGAAHRVAQVAIGEATDPLRPRDEAAPVKDPAAVALGKKGGVARAKALSPAMRKAIASDAARKRWGKTQ